MSETKDPEEKSWAVRTRIFEIWKVVRLFQYPRGKRRLSRLNRHMK